MLQHKGCGPAFQAHCVIQADWWYRSNCCHPLRRRPLTKSESPLATAGEHSALVICHAELINLLWGEVVSSVLYLFNHKTSIHRQNSTLTVEELSSWTTVRHWGSGELQAAEERPRRSHQTAWTLGQGLANCAPWPNLVATSLYSSQAKNDFSIFKESFKN